jgi:hypothetical protein
MLKAEILQVVEQKRSYLGQMDVHRLLLFGISMKKLLKSLEVMDVIYSV